MNNSPTVAAKSVAPPSSRRAWLRRAAWVVGIVGLYVVLAGGVAPMLIRRQAIQRLSALTGGPVAIDRVSFHPFALRAQVTGFRVGEPDGRPLLAWSNVVVDLELASIWRREMFLSVVAVERLGLVVRRDRDGRVNVLELARRVAGAAPAATNGTPGGGRLFPVTIANFGFTNGSVAFRDEALSEPFEVRLEPIDFHVGDLTTHTNGSGTVEFAAVDDSGGRLAWAGRIRAEPPSLEGIATGEAIALAKPRPYTDGLSTLRLNEGRLSFKLPVRFAWTNDALSAALAGGQVTVSNLVLVERGSGAPFATLPQFAIDGIDVALSESSARVGRLHVRGGTVHVRRSPAAGSGPGATRTTEVNVRGLLRPAAIEALVQDFTGWRLALDEASIEGFGATFEDTSLSPTWKTEVRDISVLLQKVSNGSNVPPSQLRTSLRWGTAGTIRLEAEATLLPATARAKLGIEAIDLAPLAPYVAQATRLDLHRGSLAGAWEASYGAQTTGASLVTVRGQFGLREFAATETVTGRDFIRWDEVQVNGMAASIEPGRVEVDEVVVRKLQTSLVLTTNGQLNALQLLRTTRELGQREGGLDGPAANARATLGGAGRTPEVGAAPGGGGGEHPFWDEWPVRLGRLRLEGVSLFAADDYYGGGFRTSVESLDGDITGFALPATEPARLDLKGRLTASSGFAVSGTLNPDPAKFGADLRVTTHKADLAQFTPYTLRFAGYPVTRGELTADVRYQIQGDALKAENKLLLDQFTLGRKTPSPDAIDLPLKLGVALLKDAEGRINLDLPLSGSLSDPQFRIMPVLWQVVRNLVVKAATAPFRFLGSLFGGGGDDDLEFVECVPGQAELAPGQTNRLHTLLKALKSRPQLQLAIHPAFDAVADKPWLATNLVEGRLKRLRADEIVATGGPPLDPATMTLTAEERERLVPQLYVKEVGALPDPASPPNLASLWERLIETSIVEPAEFQALARRRGERVKALLVGDTGVAPERVTLVDDPGGTPAEGKGRVAFRLE